MEVSSQTQALQDLRARVLQITNNPVFVSEAALTRLLIARDYNVEATYEMWYRWRSWRLDYMPQTITDSEMALHIQTGKAFFHSHDKKGRPCLIVRARFHFPSQFTAEQTLRYSIYLAETACKVSDQAGVGQICMIYDRGQITDDNQDPDFINLIREMSEVFKDFYAERLAALFILHVGIFHWILYHALKGTIPKKTREKLHVLRSPEGLLEFFDSEALLVEYGGTDTYVHAYPK